MEFRALSCARDTCELDLVIPVRRQDHAVRDMECAGWGPTGNIENIADSEVSGMGAPRELRSVCFYSQLTSEPQSESIT